MFTSFSTALSGLNATATAIDVVGNNLANLNTPGYKTNVVYFRDMVTQSLGVGETQVGFGTGPPLTIRQFTQGAIQSSPGLLDAAVQGDGFFVVRNSQNSRLYTRAGNFLVDAAGNLITNTGEFVQGWTAMDPSTGLLNTSGPTGDIVVPVGTAKPPVASTQFTMDFNLNSTALPDASSQFNSTVTVYDTLGTSHVLTVHFVKAAANQWNYNITMPGDEIAGGTAGTPLDIAGASGSVTFGSDGKMTSPAAGSPVAFGLTGLASGASDMNLSWNLYTNSGAARITQFAQPSATSAISQNGSAAAQLIRIGLGNGGKMVAQYSDGQQVTVGQLAMAAVRNPDSLIAVGNNNYQTSERTATPAIGLPNEGGRGDIMGGATESSTVDIAREFTELIVLQRSFQANSKVITTVDELSQVIIALKQ
jgi:flagellar hook protein FlgE